MTSVDAGRLGEPFPGIPEARPETRGLRLEISVAASPGNGQEALLCGTPQELAARGAHVSGFVPCHNSQLCSLFVIGTTL